MTEQVQINNKVVNIEPFRDEWIFALMRKGLIAKLNVGYWKGFTRLDYDELGITFDNEEITKFMNEYISLGTIQLLPAHVTKEIDGALKRVKTLLRQYSYHTVWGRFIPWTALNDWEKEFKTCQDEFKVLVETFGEKYEEIVSDVASEYKKLAKDSWKRLYPSDLADPTDAFITNFVNKVICKIPPKEEIIAQFRFDVVYSIILMPSIVENNIEKAKDIQRNSEKRDFEIELEKRLKAKVAEQYLQERKKYIDGFLQTTVGALRKNVVKMCDEILSSLATKQKLTASTAKKTRLLIDKVKHLNFYDDKEIASLLKEVEFELDKFKGEISIDTITQKLEEITKVATKDFDYNPAIDYLEP